MATLDDAVDAARSALAKCGVNNPDDDLLRNVVKSIGPSVYSADARNVSCGDDEELDRIANGFVKKRLGVSDGRASVDAVCQKMQPAGAHKHRGAFYYLLAVHHGKETAFA